jgi:hypothetical protein
MADVEMKSGAQCSPKTQIHTQKVLMTSSRRFSGTYFLFSPPFGDGWQQLTINKHFIDS